MWQILRNMGFGYVWFRAKYELQRRTGLLKAKFPTNPPQQAFINLTTWKNLSAQFFFESREDLRARLSAAHVFDTTQLVAQIEAYRQNKILFFSSTYYPITDWLVNPSTQYKYDKNHHWTQIADLSLTAGDIKYVWEKSRFSFLYPIIRYDFWYKHDMAETVFAEIDSWIAANPINQGPNWRCSQEIGLRVLNWTFALFYYKNSSALTEDRFQRIIYQIYWHLHHIEANIDFSRIAVRNNHAITETLSLYLGGLFYPLFDKSDRWKQNGKKWFEEEIAYQIDKDGTFLQHSMNYHRVVVQLLTWAIQLAHLNQERFADVVYERAQNSVRFLRALQNPHTGFLPNYGNNDGALFFPLNDAHFRDYRPQLNALLAALGLPAENCEDNFWYNLDYEVDIPAAGDPNSYITDAESFGSYHILTDNNTLTFIRCGAYIHRPFQADNLHVDLWVGAENIMRDAGSYLYNTDEKWVQYFTGTASHNTIMLGNFDQMRKGPRFIWYDWVRTAKGKFQENEHSSDTTIIFEGSIKAFAHVAKDIIHKRRVTKYIGKLHWTIEDWIENAPANLPMHQLWHPNETFLNNFSIEASDSHNNPINVAIEEGWYSSLYGQKEPAQQLVFTTHERYIKTTIIGSY